MILPKSSQAAAENTKSDLTGKASPNAVDDVPPPAYDNPTPVQVVPQPDLPNIKPTNFVSISRRAGEIKETFVLDPTLQLPQSIASPAPAGRPHFEATSIMGEVKTTIFVLGGTVQPNIRKTRITTSSTMGETKLMLHAPSVRAPLDISVRTSMGSAKVYLPRSFRGPLRISTTMGEVKLSKDLQDAGLKLGDGGWFIGQWSQGEAEAKTWPGDEATVQTTFGEVFVGYEDHLKSGLCGLLQSRLVFCLLPSSRFLLATQLTRLRCFARRGPHDENTMDRVDLPDEILSEILTPALRVSDDAFSDARVLGMSFTESSSACLLVCKDWLRVSTPLLYGVVILRSKAQAQALAFALQNNPDLGRFIKKLRVDGGYGRFMHIILQTTPNISELFLMFSMGSTDSVSGLVKGLPLVSPSRLFIHNASRHVSAPGKALITTIAACVPSWTKLNTVQVSTKWRDYDEPIVPELVAAFANCQTLVSFVLAGSETVPLSVPGYMKVISAAPSLKRIVFRPPLRPEPSGNSVFFYRKFYEGIRGDPRLRQLITIPVESNDEELAAAGPEPSLFVYPARLSADPQQEDEIWGRVLGFVFKERTPSTGRFAGSVVRGLEQQPKNYLAPVLACRMFARLAIPHLYETPFLYTDIAQHNFSLILAGSRGPTLGPYVREITVNEIYDLALLGMLQHTPRLESIVGHGSDSTLPASALELLAKSVGNSLRTLRNVAFDKPLKGGLDPTPMALFTQLVFLEWDCKAPFKSLRNLSATALGNLTTLAIREYHPTFLALLSDLQLPALQSVEFPAVAGPRGASAFFRKHGPKLVRATLGPAQLTDAELGVLSLCPALTELRIAYNQNHPVRSLHFDPTTAHANLRRILFVHPAKKAYLYYRMSRPHRALFGEFIQGICNASTREDPADQESLVLLPALEEIQHPHCCWPRTEKEIARDEWVEWAEKLFDAGSPVHLIGTERVRWRRRLQFDAGSARKSK
ncbi:F-box domain-containing protein [Mycena chlorophos]|uniref:F-box domain-containing protein n=1 Tax=Mycena chlorophos TaxID=658473 RepID=A0A8H6WJG5_MYCCL|nr:F-box domain-containing protein [Mycena chlorophos]